MGQNQDRTREVPAAGGRVGTVGRSRRLAVNTLALTMGKLLSKVLVFFMVRLYTWVLTDAQYGTADLITNLCNLLIPVACAGLSQGFFRFVADADGDRERSQVFSSGLCVLCGAGTLFALLSPLFFFSRIFSPYVALILVYVLVANLHYFVSEFIRGMGKYRLYAVQGVLNTLLNIALNLLFLLPMGLRVEGYVLAIVGADFLTSVFLIGYARLWRYIRPGAADRQMMRAIRRYCVPLIPMAICWWITGVSDRYMVTWIVGAGENGLYTAAYKIPNLLTVACGVFMDAWQFSAVLENRSAGPSEVAEERRRRRQAVSSFFSKVYRGYMAFLFLGCAALILLYRPLARVMFDASFAGAEKYIPLLLTATLFSALGNFVGSAYMVEKRSINAFWTAMIGAVLNIALNAVLIPVYGAMGAAVATLIAYLAVLLIRLVDAYRSVPFRRYWLCFGVNSALLLALAVLATREVRWVWWLLPSAGLTFLNVPSLMRNGMQWWRQRHAAHS